MTLLLQNDRVSGRKDSRAAPPAKDRSPVAYPIPFDRPARPLMPARRAPPRHHHSDAISRIRRYRLA